MAKDKNSFVFYISWYSFFKRLDKDRTCQCPRCKLDYLIEDYVTDVYKDVPIEEITSGDPAVDMAFQSIAEDLHSAYRKWKDTCKKRSEAGKLGGAPKGNQNANKQKQANQANGCFDKQKQAKQTKQADNDNVDDNVDDNDNVPKGNKESVKEKSTPSRFIPPTLEQITQYCNERNNLVDPVRFFNFYQSKGWMVGKNKMKDWKAAVRTWEKEAGFKTSGEDYSGYEYINGKYYYGGFECLVVPPEVKRKFEG